MVVFVVDIQCNLFFSGILIVFKKIDPKRNRHRILGSTILFIVPVLFCGVRSLASSFELIIQMLVLYAIASWFFVAYPIGGYSHAVFHLLMIVPMTILLLRAAENLEVSIHHVEKTFCLKRN